MRSAGILAITLSLVLSCATAFAAAPPGSLRLKSAAIFQRSDGGVTYTCGKVPPWSVGRMVSGAFYPTKVEIAAIKKKLKAARTSSAKNKLRAQLNSLNAKLALGKSLCASGPPTPTPTPGTGNSLFDAQGFATSIGKALFQIPAGIEANAGRGITTWNQNCNGCHHMLPAGLLIKSYPAIRARIQLSPMSFSVPAEISDQQIADITAIANY